MTTACIMQPTYLGWLGYFDLIDQSDVFVLLDTVAVSPKSWQTRTRIRARDGNVVWLSVPTNARRGMPLENVRIVNDRWQVKHWRTLAAAYAHAPFWSDIVEWLSDCFYEWLALIDMTGDIIAHTAKYLGIETPLYEASVLNPRALAADDPFERIRDICAAVGATELLNTPGARDWLEGHDVGVPVRWHQYEHPVYSQGDAPWCSHLSVVDLLAWHGPESLDIIRSGRR